MNGGNDTRGAMLHQRRQPSALLATQRFPSRRPTPPTLLLRLPPPSRRRSCPLATSKKT